MDSAFEIADSTDWLNTPLAALANLENALHCQICKEFYDTPMITSCSHTFCSRCIRTSLSADGRCPACRASDQASKLRNNWQLQEVVASFQAARAPALRIAKAESEKEQAGSKRRAGKRKRTVMDSDDIQEEISGRTTRSKTRRIAPSQTSQPDVVTIGDTESDGDYGPEPQRDDGLVECPLGCGKRMKIEAVEPHLDRCDDEKKADDRAKSRASAISLREQGNFARYNSRPQDRISELNYSLLKDQGLRDKLKGIGIPTGGSKQHMVRRHTEWVNIWNANCDSNHPRSKRELLQDLEAWERTQGGRAPAASGPGHNVMRKDFDGSAWQSKHTDDFARLIADAKRKKTNTTPGEGSSKGAENKAPSTEPTANGAGQGAPIQLSDRSPEVIVRAGESLGDVRTGKTPRVQVDPPDTLAQHPQDHHAERAKKPTDPVDGAQNPALLQQSHFGVRGREGGSDPHVSNRDSTGSCDLPSHIGTAPARKMPMFEMPSQPVNDIDQGGGKQ